MKIVIAFGVLIITLIIGAVKFVYRFNSMVDSL